jgi:hypothetical protein
VGYGVTTLPHLRNLAVMGPYEVTGVSDTATRRAIFSCRPTAPKEDVACARRIIERLGTLAYRRPLSSREVEQLTGFYQQGAQAKVAGGFEGGIRTSLQAMLSSLPFLFRIEEMPSTVAPGGTYRISDIDLASRLSFYLWGTIPDRALLDAARAGQLSQPGGIPQQVRRMLADPRAEALATRFAAQWLRLQDLHKVEPDALSFPYYDESLAAAMERETESLFTHVVRADRPVLELLTADYTFVNERLARHYGIAGVSGPEFRQVSYPDDRRRGLLGHGSILTLTSHGNRTSPVLRGKWVLEVLFGAPPPPPPPDVPDLEKTSEAENGRFRSVAEQLAMHRASPRCSSCHNVIDPIGLALDQFDVTGAWRIKDRGVLVKTEGELYDGTKIDGAAGLRAAILSRSDVVLTAFHGNADGVCHRPACGVLRHASDKEDRQGCGQERVPRLVSDSGCGGERSVSDRKGRRQVRKSGRGASVASLEAGRAGVGPREQVKDVRPRCERSEPRGRASGGGPREQLIDEGHHVSDRQASLEARGP